MLRAIMEQTIVFCFVVSLVNFLLLTQTGAKSLVFTADQRDILGEELKSCGYESCNPVKDGMINIHVVPHTHDDVGWLITVDQYYYQRVQYILDTVIPQLQEDPSRRFIYVEIAFLKRWWDEQDDTMRHIVEGLVSQGRLEFILGGWSMNDEACTHYNAIIDQHTLGFRFLEETFGDCARPRVAWQIDPFGHSREQASLFAQMGFDGLFFGRLDYQDKDKRLTDKTMEMVWKGSSDLGSAADLFTGALYSGYNPPDGICFTYDCADPVQDDKALHDYNVPEKVATFLKDVYDQAKHYATDHLIMTMGSDFEYTDAITWYRNLNKIIKYVNEQQTLNNTKVNLLYSTPSCYLYQLNRANKTWTTKDDDFFPYAHKPHAVWTGFYTSRAALKGYVRQTNNFFQVCKQLDVLAQLPDSQIRIEVLKEAMGVAQHHDGVSGTEKQAVAYDYAERLANGVNKCRSVISDAYKNLLNKTQTPAPFEQSFCGLMNISTCKVTESNNQFVIVAYNPLGRSVTHWVRIPVTGMMYAVTSPNGSDVPTQVVPISDRTKSIPERHGVATKELVFQMALPALGFSTYFVKAAATDTAHDEKEEDMEWTTDVRNTVIENEYISLTFDDKGRLSAMKNIESDISIQLNQDFAYYTSFNGNNSKPQFQASGAYVFRPNEMEPNPFPIVKSVKSNRMMAGELVQEVSQTFSPWVTQVVRLYKGTKYAEIEWTVGPIPIQDKVGKEIINRLQTNLNTDQKYYTDANGREILERKLNYRPTWNLNQTEPVAGNYYPINSRIYIQDAARNIQLTVLTDRSEGGGSLKNGEIEIMVHRRLLHNDGLGPGVEALNETGSDGKGLIVRGKHYIFLETIDKSAALHRDFALQLYMGQSLSFIPTTMTFDDWSDKYRTSWSGLRHELPANVHLLTLEQWQGGSYLTRFEHFYEANEDPSLSKPANFSMTDMFEPFNIQTALELTLGANQKKSEERRLHWRTISDKKFNKKTESSPSRLEDDPVDVTLNPMQIRTYEVTTG